MARSTSTATYLAGQQRRDGDVDVDLHLELAALAEEMDARADAGGVDYTDADMDRFYAICDAHGLSETQTRAYLRAYLRFT